MENSPGCSEAEPWVCCINSKEPRRGEANAISWPWSPPRSNRVSHRPSGAEIPQMNAFPGFHPGLFSPPPCREEHTGTRRSTVENKPWHELGEPGWPRPGFEGWNPAVFSGSPNRKLRRLALVIVWDVGQPPALPQDELKVQGKCRIGRTVESERFAPPRSGCAPGY